MRVSIDYLLHLFVSLCLYLFITLTAVHANGGEKTIADADVSGIDSVVLLQGDALFGFDKDVLSISGNATLDRLISRLSALNDLLSIHIIGHTDSTGDATYNHDLSLRRAITIAHRIEESFPNTRISFAGAGEGQPLGNNGTVTGRKLNRRVEIEIVGLGDYDRWHSSP